MGEGWDPLKESLCEYVQRSRIEEQMRDTYDDRVERRIEQGRALCLWWSRPPKEAPVVVTLVLDGQLDLWPTTVHDESEVA